MTDVTGPNQHEDNAALSEQVLLAWEAYKVLAILSSDNERLRDNPYFQAAKDSAYARFLGLFNRWVKP